MVSYVCGECRATFEESDELRDHHEACDAIPDCRQCGASFEQRENWFAHVYLGGCPSPAEAPPQPPQDRITVEGTYEGQTRRLL